MKLFVFFVFLLIKADGKNDELSQNQTNQLYDVEKSSNQSFLLAPRPPKVQQDENGVTFNADAKVNVTLTERRFQLIVYDPDVTKTDNQKPTSFCFKAKRFVQTEKNPQCLPNYCEIKVDYDIVGSELMSVATFGNESILVPNSSIKIEVTENKMYVIGKENEAVNFCELDDEEGYLPVQLVNKGDRHVHVNGVKIYKDASRVGISDATIVNISAGSCAIFLIIFSLIWFIVYCSKKSRNNPIPKAEKEPKQKNDAKVVQKQVSNAQITNK